MSASKGPEAMPLSQFVKAKDSPPVRLFFFISAFYCDKGLLAFFIQAALDFWMRLRHGPRSLTAQKTALTCLVRQVSRLLMAPTQENLQQARELLQDAEARLPAELAAPVHSLQGRLLLFHEHPPSPKAALEAYEKALAVLRTSPYLALLSQPHNLLFGAAMAAVLMRQREKAEGYFQQYQEFVAKKPRKRWGAEVEKDLAQRIEELRRRGG